MSRSQVSYLASLFRRREGGTLGSRARSWAWVGASRRIHTAPDPWGRARPKGLL